MFDVSFSELVVIALVALIVIGPERLPKVARTVGALLGRLQRYVNDVKADINREIQLDELKKLQQQVAEQAQGMEQSVSQQLKSTETALNESLTQGLDKRADQPPADIVPPALASDVPVEPPKA
jgi:sec-independent protein translocase protein TatB